MDLERHFLWIKIFPFYQKVSKWLYSFLLVLSVQFSSWYFYKQTMESQVDNQLENSVNFPYWGSKKQGKFKKSSPAPQFENINSLALSHLYGPTFSSTHFYWKSYSFDSTHLCWQSDVCFLISCIVKPEEVMVLNG